MARHTGHDEEPDAYASPPCFLHELDPAWTGAAARARPTPRASSARSPPASGGRTVVAEDGEIVAFVDHAPIRARATCRSSARAHLCLRSTSCQQTWRRGSCTWGSGSRGCHKALYGVARVGFVFSGNDVAHVHAHVIPLHEPTDVTSRRFIAERELTFTGRPKARTGDGAGRRGRVGGAVGSGSRPAPAARMGQAQGA